MLLSDLELRIQLLQTILKERAKNAAAATVANALGVEADKTKSRQTRPGHTALNSPLAPWRLGLML